MVPYDQQVDLDRDFLWLAALPGAPPAAGPVSADDDWPGVQGCCDALRAPATERPAAPGGDEGDWGCAGAA